MYSERIHFLNAFNVADFCLRLRVIIVMWVFIGKSTLLLGVALNLFLEHGYQTGAKGNCLILKI